MLPAAITSQIDVCVQTIRTRIASGFAKLTERLDAIYEVEGFDILDMFHELTTKIQEIAPPAPKKSGRKLKPTQEGNGPSDYVYGIRGLSDYLGVSPPTAQKYVNSGKLDAAIRKVGRKYSFNKATVDAIFQKR